jgi:uncharacterized repeat protein (TIGR03803 family)
MCRIRFLVVHLILIPVAMTLVLGASAWASDTLTVLYDFNNIAYFPIGNLVFDSMGNLYGTAFRGGYANPNCSFDCGTVFRLSPAGGTWAFEVLYSFTGGADGGEPHGRLTLDSKGNLYGTTYDGGIVNASCPTGCGTVFELSPSGSGWNFTLLHSFVGSDGQAPWTGLTPDALGNLYGTTTSGGTGGAGTIFELSSSGLSWTFSTLYALANSGREGEFPFSDLAIDGNGNVYGAAQQGGNPNSSCSNYCGTVFELSFTGGTWKFTLLRSFMGAKYKDGGLPWGSLVLDSFGNLYGTTFEGGRACDCGTVFKLSQSTGQWKENILYRFSQPNYGNPVGGLTIDKVGNLYGTTLVGNVEVFELSPTSKGGHKFTSLFGPASSADGFQPYAGVILDTSGNLYGTTTQGGLYSEGTLFELSPK